MMWWRVDSSYWRLSAFYAAYFALLGGLAPYWTLYLRDRGFNPLEIGQLMAILMLTRLVAPNLWGWLADISHQRLRLVRGGSLLAFLCFCGFYWAEGFWTYAWLMAAFSFFWTAVLPQFEVITLHNLGPLRERYSLVRVWGSIGFIVTVGVIGKMLDAVSTDWLPLVLAFLLFLIWLSSLQTFIEPQTAPQATRSGGFLAILRQPPVASFFIITFLLQLSHGPYYTFYSIYLQSAGYSFDAVGMLWALGVIAEVVLFLVMHRLLASYSLRNIIALSLILTAARWLMVPWLIHSGPWMAVAQLLHAFSFGAMHAASIEFIHRHFSGRHQGQGQAFYSSSGFGAGGSLGAFCSGFVYSQWGGSWTFFMAALVAALAVPLAIYGLRDPASETPSSSARLSNS